MLGSYVCKQCRTRLSRRILPVRNPQWQPRATFLSLRRDRAPGDAEPAQPGVQPQDQLDDPQKGGQAKSRIRYIEKNEQSQPQRRIGRYSRHVEGDAESGEQSSAAQANVEAAGGEESLKISITRGHGPASAIEEALRRRNVDEAWGLFEGNYTSRDCEAFTNPAQSDVALLNEGRVFANLLKDVNGAFCNRRVKPAVTPTVVLFRYEQLGLARQEYWARQTLAYLTHRAILAVNASPNESVRDLPAILFELLSVWRLFFQCKGTKKAPLESISTQWNLPAIEALPDLFESRDFNMRLQEFHPGYVGDATLGFCAVYFYTLSDALNAIESLHKDAEPFIQFLSRLLASSFVSSVFNHTKSFQFKALPQEVKNEILREINNAPRRALTELGSEGGTLGPEATGDPAANLEEFHLKRIARAVESNSSAKALDSLWTEVVTTFTVGDKPAIPHRIYNAFLSGYMVLFQAQRSVDVWNHMIAHGINPDIQSWVALLEGCVKAKDSNGFNAMWTRMLNTGIEPDSYAWTTRIHGLFSLRQVTLGLAALDDMGKRWIVAETVINNPQTHSRNRKGAKNLPSSTKVVNNCTKPSIEVINGAVTALVKIPAAAMRHEKRVELVQKILAWAGNFSIKPDAITYNSLIQLYLRAADYTTAFKVLRQMDKDGIKGDIATHNMLISVSFDNRSFDGLTQAEQAEKIIALFNSLEAGGLKLNNYVYGTAIDRLLKQYSNHNAVRQIIEHMRERKMEPSAHVYSSLITYYFQQDPPAIAAVDSLVDQFFTSRRVPTDRYLFDRTIEGYASHGEVGKMMSVLTRMSKHGTLPGWPALTAVVEALVNDGDMDRAGSVVRDVERGEGVAKGGITGGRQGQSRFFGVVKSLGVGLEDQKMGDFLMDDRAVRASEDDAVLGQQLREQEILQMTRNEEAQEDMMRTTEHQHTPSQRYQQEAAGVQYEQEPGSVQYEREPGSVPGAEMEDVHGFLTDEHKDIHSRINRP